MSSTAAERLSSHETARDRRAGVWAVADKKLRNHVRNYFITFTITFLLFSPCANEIRILATELYLQTIFSVFLINYDLLVSPSTYINTSHSLSPVLKIRDHYPEMLDRNM